MALTKKTNPSPYESDWMPRPARYGVGVQHNVAIPMSDGVTLRADIHYPTMPDNGEPAGGLFPVLVSITPYGKKAPPPAGQIGGGPIPYLVERGYIEVMVDVRGTGTSDGSFEMFGDRQALDGAELVRWASTLPGSTGRVGMFGISYLGINQLFTAATVGPDSPLKAIMPVMAANDFYRDVASMGGMLHLFIVRAFGSMFSVLNVVNPLIELINRGQHQRPRAGGLTGVRRRGRLQRNYFRPLIKEAKAGGEVTHDGVFWDAYRPGAVLSKIADNGVAVFLVGGWHDVCQRGAPLNYAALQNAAIGRPDVLPMQPGQSTTDRVRLMIGPWYHATDFDGLDFHALQLRWFDYWLTDDAEADLAGTPLVFQAIGAGQQWFNATEYPLPEATPTLLYLSDAGRLTRDDSPTSSAAVLDYTARGPVSGRSVEQWGLGLYSYLRSRLGRPIQYDQENPRSHPGAPTYLSEPFTSPKLVAGPINLTLYATSTTAETMWVAYLDDVAPDGTNTPLTQGALLGSRRALDPDRTWYLPDGNVLRPHHKGTSAAVEPVVAGEVTRYDLEIFPTAALILPGHRLRLTITTYDFPHLHPTKKTRRRLEGGRYEIQQGGTSASHIIIPLADPETLRQRADN